MMTGSQQGTEGWLLERLGSVTGSRFVDIIAMDKSGKKFLKSRETAITEITLELLTGSPGAMWTSKATNWGKEHEPHARLAYEQETGEICREVGFIRHPHHMQVGCSPDGLIGEDGGIEIKSPQPHAHLASSTFPWSGAVVAFASRCFLCRR